jgi:hypothetical protein
VGGFSPAAGNYLPGLEKLGRIRRNSGRANPPPSFTTPDKMLLKVPLSEKGFGSTIKYAVSENIFAGY